MKTKKRKKRNKIGKPCDHAWVEKWEGQFRRCSLCKQAQWWWVCEERWSRTMPSSYLYAGHKLNRDTARSREWGRSIAGAGDAFHHSPVLSRKLRAAAEKGQTSFVYEAQRDIHNDSVKHFYGK